MHSLFSIKNALSLAFTTPFTRIIITPSMQKPLPISRCPSHSMPSQSEIESKTAHNRNATQCTPQISIPHFHLPSFHSRKAQHPQSFITPIPLETLLHYLSSPFSNTSPSQTTQFPTFPIHTPKPTKYPISFNFQFHYPSPIFFILLLTPIQQSPPICFQSQNLPSHHHQHAPTNPPHPSSPNRQSISNSPPKEKKAQHTHSPPSISLLLSIQKKAKQCIFTTSRFTNRRWCNARSMVGAVCADVRDIGNFSSPKTEEFIISRGNIIELWRLDESGNVNVICSYEVYGLIRSLKPFRLSGTSQSTSITRRKRHGFHSHRLGQRTHRGAAVQR